jgi:hypothetical protein
MSIIILLKRLDSTKLATVLVPPVAHFVLENLERLEGQHGGCSGDPVPILLLLLRVHSAKLLRDYFERSPAALIVLPGQQLDVIDARADLVSDQVHEGVEFGRKGFARQQLDHVGHVVTAGEGRPLRAGSDEAGVPEQPPEPVARDAVVPELVKVQPAAGEVRDGLRRAAVIVGKDVEVAEVYFPCVELAVVGADGEAHLERLQRVHVFPDERVPLLGGEAAVVPLAVAVDDAARVLHVERDVRGAGSDAAEVGGHGAEVAFPHGDGADGVHCRRRRAEICS